jgi:hypothetical protein
VVVATYLLLPDELSGSCAGGIDCAVAGESVIERVFFPFCDSISLIQVMSHGHEISRIPMEKTANVKKVDPNERSKYIRM